MEKIEDLFLPLVLPNGATIPNRIAMAPMTTKGATYDGIVLKEDIDFYSSRSSVGGLIITGATAVSEHGEAFFYQASVSDDRFIEGLSKLASVMKKEGGRAILQIYHGGRQAEVSQKNLGVVFAPSFIEFPFLEYDVKELQLCEIWSIIDDFGQATRRAISAGFDGIEIHGANHHLIQQFFSSYSNRREDYFGGSLRKRMNFPLEIIKAVKKVVSDNASKEFIIGYRITQTEIHGENVGYGIEDSLQLIDEVLKIGIDYLHVSRPEYGDLIKQCISNRAAYIFMPRAASLNEVVHAASVGDMVSIGRLAILNPAFSKTIKTKPEKISYELTSVSTIETLDLPTKLKYWFTNPDSGIPKFKGTEFLE